MNMKTNEEILKEIAETRHYTYRTIIGYQTAIRSYTEYFGQPLYELITEAEEEEVQGIRWKERKLKKRLLEFRSYLLDNYLLTTAQGYLMKVQSIYRYYEIEIHPLPYISLKRTRQNVPLSFNDLPDKEIISQAINMTDSLMTAIILFISSSGSAKAETLSLTVGDFVESLQDYTHEQDIYKVISELKGRNDLIPTFKLKRKKINQYYYTFCSPECTEAIFDYLLTRKRNLTNDMPLFKINEKYLSDRLGEINDSLGLGKRSGFNRFRSHMLRKYHATNLSNEENSLTERDIDFLQGRSDKKTRQSYFFTDKEKLKARYAKSMNAVTIFYKYNVIVDTKGEVFVDVYNPEEELIPLQEREVQLRKENQVLSKENKKLIEENENMREEIKAEARKVFLELLEENNIEL